ncbi:MAG TPA: hypothetical protein VIS74_01490, partial [Chthoniobacterales bacterium]
MRTFFPFIETLKTAFWLIVVFNGGLLLAEPEPQPAERTAEAAKSAGQELGGARLARTRAASPEEERALKAAVDSFAARKKGDDFRAIEQYVESEKGSPYRLAAMRDLGLQYYASGRFGKALQVWEEAWAAGKGSREPGVKEVIDDVFGELIRLHSRLGHLERLEALKKELGDRKLSGSAETKALNGWEAVWLMKSHPEASYRCGPLALGRVIALKKGDPKVVVDEGVKDFLSTARGTSLEQVYEASRALGGGYQMAKRGPGAAMLLPAVVHWKVGHFAAVTGRHGPNYVVQDSTFDDQFVFSEEALDEEASGYFLVPEGPLPPGWTPVGKEEAEKVWGKGQPGNTQDKKNCPKGAGNQDCGGGSKKMAQYAVTLLTVGLNVRDTPLWYEPAYGPEVHFTVQYNQRDAYQPVTLPYANVGRLWACNYVGFITFNPTVKPWPLSAQLYDGGGSVTDFTFPPSSETTFQTTTSAVAEDGSVLKYLPAQSSGTSTTAAFERTFPDGSKQLYAFADGSAGTVARSYLTGIVSPQGPQLNLVWEQSGGNFFLRKIQDAAGKETTFTYEANSVYPTRIRGVQDPFGRSAAFTYDVLGRLSAITDMGGITSQFEYEAADDLIHALITPYGRTQFSSGVSNQNAINRWIEITDPAGAKERVEFWNDINGLSGAVDLSDFDSGDMFPSGVSGTHFGNGGLLKMNTFYWNRKAM